MLREGMSFVEYQSNMVSLAKNIAMTTQEMVGKAGVNPSDLGRLANQLTRDYDLLASNSANAAATSNSQDVSWMIRNNVKAVLKVVRIKKIINVRNINEFTLTILEGAIKYMHWHHYNYTSVPIHFQPNVVVVDVFGHVCVMSKLVYRYIENECFVSRIST